MSTSGKRSLIFIIVFLLLTNIGVLGYFLWFNKPPRPAPGTPKGLSTALQNEVGFDETQVSEYKKLKEKHWASLKPMFEDLRKAKDSLFRLVGNSQANDSMINTIADVIALKQKEIDLKAFSHFKEIRTLCRADQLVKYDSLVQRLVRKMGRAPKGEAQKEEKK